MDGLVMSNLGAGALRGFLFGIEPFDPWTFVAAAGLLAGTAVLAAVVPARRAGRAELATMLQEV